MWRDASCRPILNIVPVLPGKTLGVLYCACYGPASVLKYHELIIAPALVRRGTSHRILDISHLTSTTQQLRGWQRDLGTAEAARSVSLGA